ncbi:MAG: hypothetical protein M3Y51_05015, partial [Actinomycetota bacterium]|nr:hypothetical protein [Actinomycetota bacterium]
SWLRPVLLVLGAVLVVVTVAAVLVIDGAVFSRGDAATEELPPSERGAAPTTSVPQVVGDADRRTQAARSGERFEELECVFSGTSTLDPPLPSGSYFGGGEHRMALEPGARFECEDGAGRSSGTVALDAAFDSLNLLGGVAAGTGSIDWSELGPGREMPGQDAPASATVIEVQLDYPVIVVWTTITTGPYAGFRGRLVLRDWEQIYDDAGGISGVEFARTTTTFAPE